MMTGTEKYLFGQLLSHSADGSITEMGEIHSLCDHISEFGLRDELQYKIARLAVIHWVGSTINRDRQVLEAAVEYYELRHDISQQKKELGM